MVEKTPPSAAGVRRAARVPADDLAASVRFPPASAWHKASVEELSSTGCVLIVPVGVAVGSPVEVELRHAGDAPAVLAGEVVRVVDNDKGEATALRWLMLGDDERDFLTREIDRRAQRIGAEEVETATGKMALSAAGMQGTSVYELLKIDPASSTTALAARIQEALAAVARAEPTATGEKLERYRALKKELSGLGAALGDPLKRASYDFRFGHVRADARIADAQRNKGPSVEALRKEWQRLFPERVAGAADLAASAADLSGAERTEVFDEALALDPFDGELRMRRADARSSGRFAPAGEERGVRGNLKDLGLAEIIQTFESKAAEIELWQGGKAVGVIGVRAGVIVHACTGATNSEEAFYALMTVTEGSFVILHGAPRAGLQKLSGSAMGMMLEGFRRIDEQHLSSVVVAELIPPFRLTSSQQGPRAARADARARAAEDALVEADGARLEAERKAAAEAQQRESLLATVKDNADVVRKQLMVSEQARIDAELAARHAGEERARLESELAAARARPAAARPVDDAAQQEAQRRAAEREQEAKRKVAESEQEARRKVAESEQEAKRRSAAIEEEAKRRSAAIEEEAARRAAEVERAAERRAAEAAERERAANEAVREASRSFERATRPSQALSLVVAAVAGLVVGVVVVGAVYVSGADARAQIDRLGQAQALVQQGKLDSARAVLEALAADRPDVAVVARDLGDVCARAGDRAAAAGHYRRYLQLAPTAPDAAQVRAALGE